MEPSQVASTLRRIASAIEKSKRPDKDLVARDLKKVIAALPGQTPVHAYVWNGEIVIKPSNIAELQALINKFDLGEYNFKPATDMDFEMYPVMSIPEFEKHLRTETDLI